ncbi:MAG: tetratricopeptide repeat protein [Deltaproteobacteria bacterium]|nr:tetratricopeptide repeat protein [Deltaproteobacteria bacterium]
MIVSDPQQMQFLIVDDMDNMRHSIRAMLRLIKFGKRYYEAANGREAWKILNQGSLRVDFVISDWLMPKMNGTELLNQLRTTKKLRNIPFLMITADANQGIVAEAAENDVDAYLTKPFVTATLEQKIKELLYQAEHPDKSTLLLNKATIWREKGALDHAIACVRKAAEINPRSSRPLRELGRLFLKKNDLVKGEAFFKKALAVNRMDVPSYHYLGQIYFKLGKTEQAINYFSKALDLSPRNAGRALKVATLLLKNSRLKEAEKIFKTMLRNNRGNLDLYEDVAELSLEHGLYKLAINNYKKILEEDPGRDYLQKKLGEALLKGEFPQEAIVVFEKIVTRFPEDISLMLDLAQAYLNIKMRMRADKWASKAAMLDPENKLAREIMAKV